MSIGGIAKRLCSLCGDDLSECEHTPGTSYLVPGGVSSLGWCRVCLQETCEHTPDQNHRVSVVGIIKEMDLVEVSFVPKPVDLEQYRVRRQARVGGLINEYRLVV